MADIEAVRWDVVKDSGTLAHQLIEILTHNELGVVAPLEIVDGRNNAFPCLQELRTMTATKPRASTT